MQAFLFRINKIILILTIRKRKASLITKNNAIIAASLHSVWNYFLMKNTRTICSVLLALLPSLAIAQSSFIVTTPETKTAQYFNSINTDSAALLAFLENMPKGGDLHIHLAGAVYPENLITYAKDDKFCLDPQNFTVSVQSNCNTYTLGDLADHPDVYNKTIDAWSLRNFNSATESQHDHFFNTFFKVFPLIGPHDASILSEIVTRAANENISYLELITTGFDLNIPTTADGDPAMALGKRVGWNDNFAQLRQTLMSQGMPQIITQLRQHLDTMEATSRAQLHCDSATPAPGCAVKVRYLYFALREQQPAEFFAQMLSAFEMANSDPRVVGVNIVQAEDGYIALRDYDLQMRIINYLHTVYPKVHITLHAGELSPASVTPENLRFHIRDAVEIAHADRIGHGVDIAYESNSQQLLNEMAQKHILVEMNLTSNADLLGITGDDDPLPLYLDNHVPVVLSTDDEGVLRTDLTREFERAILTYHLSYPTIKTMVRNSISYSFLPGNSLWQSYNNFMPVTACAHDKLGSTNATTTCQQFLQSSEKAQMQWQLEGKFAKFEQAYS